MKHIITVNGKYLSNWKEDIKENGYVFAYDLEFTTIKSEAKPVEFRTVISLLTAIRNNLTPRGVISDDTISYNIITEKGKNSVTTPITPRRVAPIPLPDTLDGITDPYRRAIVELDWLNHFCTIKGITPVDLAIALGFDGKRVYYGTKVLNGGVAIRYWNILSFAKKYPEIHGHWYLAKKG